MLNKVDTFLYELREKVKVKKCMSKYPDYKDDEYNCGSLKHIWGIASLDSLTGDKANFYTMNDIDITYDRETKLYFLGVETIYHFPNHNYGAREYTQRLLDRFTEWMESEGRDTNYQLSLHEVFTDGVSINSKFKSIEKLYATFKLLVTGFQSVTNK